MSKFDGIFRSDTFFSLFFLSFGLIFSVCHDTLDIRIYFHRDDDQSKPARSPSSSRSVHRHPKIPNLCYTLHCPPLSCGTLTWCPRTRPLNDGHNKRPDKIGQIIQTQPWEIITPDSCQGYTVVVSAFSPKVFSPTPNTMESTDQKEYV
jgi:hypothetical protein